MTCELISTFIYSSHELLRTSSHFLQYLQLVDGRSRGGSKGSQGSPGPGGARGGGIMGCGAKII